MIYLFYLYVFLLPLEYLQAKLPQGPTGINYATLSMLVLAVAWLVRQAWLRRSLVPRSPVNGALLFFLVLIYLGLIYGAVTVPGVESPFLPDSPALQWFLQLFNGFLVFWVASALLDSRRRIRQALFSVAAASPLVLRAFRSDLEGVQTWHYSESMRISGPFLHLGSNELAAFFLYSCIFFGLYCLRARGWGERLVYALTAALYSYGLLYSYSRGAQLAFLVAMLWTVTLRHRWAIPVVVLAAATASFWLPASVLDRWEMTVTDEGELETSAQSREDFAGFALQGFLERPLFGHGVLTFAVLSPYQMDAHNLYLRMLFESGLLGLTGLLAIFGTLLYVGYSVWRGADLATDRQLGFAFLTATLAMLVANAFGDRFTHIAMIGHYWVLAGATARLQASLRGYCPLEDEDTTARRARRMRPRYVLAGSADRVSGARGWRP